MGWFGKDTKHEVSASNVATCAPSMPYQIYGSSYTPVFAERNDIDWQDMTWGEAVSLITDDSLNLRFDPKKDQFFDDVVKESAGEKIAKLLEKDEKKHENLRINLAILRNTAYHHFFPKGEFDDEEIDEKARDEALLYVAQLAEETGWMLKRGHDVISNPFGSTVSISKANQPDGVGGASLYHELQKQNDWHNSAAGKMQSLFRENIAPNRWRKRDWELPPIEQTPFGRLYERTNPTGDTEYIDQSYVDEAYVAEQQEIEAYRQVLLDNNEDLASLTSVQDAADVSDDLADIASQLNNVDDLQNSVKDRAVKIAHDILDNLRIQFADMPISQLLDNATQPIVAALFKDLSTVADTYNHHLDIALKFDPDMANDVLVLEANEALGIFSYQAKLNAIEQAQMQALALEASGDASMAAEMRDRMALYIEEAKAMPAAYKQEGNLTVSELLDKVEAGLDRVVNRMQDITQGQNALGIGNELALSMQPQAAARQAHELPDGDKKQDDQQQKVAKDNMAAQAMRLNDEMKKMLRERRGQQAQGEGKEGASKPEAKNNIKSAKGLKKKLTVSAPKQKKAGTDINMIAASAMKDIRLEAFELGEAQDREMVKPNNFKDGINNIVSAKGMNTKSSQNKSFVANDKLDDKNKELVGASINANPNRNNGRTH